MTVDDICTLIKTALSETQPITLESSAENVTGWDSLGHIDILMGLDEKLDGKISDIPEMATARSVRKIIEVLQTKGYSS